MFSAKELKKELSIENIISSYGINLRLSGNYFKGLCPFHDDHVPSFLINRLNKPDRWYCTVCRTSGDIFDFISKQENLDLRKNFIKIMGIALKRTGFVKPEFIDSIKNHKNPRNRAYDNKENFIKERHSDIEKFKVFEILNICVNYWHNFLPDEIKHKYLLATEPFSFWTWNSKENKPTLKSFTPYGFNEQTITKFKIGFAPKSSKEIVGHIRKEGFKKEEILATGLFIQSGKGVRCIYNGRLIFPYFDTNGKVVYTIGRQTELTPISSYEAGKYKKQYTSNNKIYVHPYIQNNTFYNEKIIKTTDWLVITEGVTDCIKADQMGIPCTSPVTIGFRKQDLPKLAEICKRKEVFICNDNEINQAGLNGAMGTHDFFKKSDILSKIIILPRGNRDKVDLCSYFDSHTKEDFLKLTKNV